MTIKNFEDLEVWKLSLELTREIYDLTATSPFNHDFGLRDQIQRAVVSVSSNIVEGFEKRNNNEFIRYLRIAKGSLGEVKNQLYIALALKYVSQGRFDKTVERLEKVSVKMGALISYLTSLKNKTTK